MIMIQQSRKIRKTYAHIIVICLYIRIMLEIQIIYQKKKIYKLLMWRIIISK